VGSGSVHPVFLGGLVYGIYVMISYDVDVNLPSGYLLHSHGLSMALIEIDGLPNLEMVDLSMAIAVSHKQMSSPSG